MTIANDLALRDVRGLVRDVVGRIEPRHMSQEHAQAMLAQLTELGVLDIGGDPADGGLGLEGAAVVLGQLSRGWGSLAWAAFPRVLLGALAIGPSAGVIGLAASQLGAFARGARLTASGQVSGTLADVLNGASGELILVLGPEAVATVGPDAVIEVADGGQFEGFRYVRHDDVTAQGTGRPLAVPPEQAVTVARALTAAVAVGIAEASVVSARDYQRQRIQFGRPIAEFGEMRAMLADAAAQVYAAREAMLAAARLSPGTAGMAAAAASAFLRASAAAVRASEMAQHSHGGYGHMAEFAVHDLVRDARMVAVCGGQRPDVDEAVLTGIDLV